MSEKLAYNGCPTAVCNDTDPCRLAIQHAGLDGAPRLCSRVFRVTVNASAIFDVPTSLQTAIQRLAMKLNHADHEGINACPGEALLGEDGAPPMGVGQ